MRLRLGTVFPHTMNLLLLQSYPDSRLFARFFRHGDCPPLSSIIWLSVLRWCVRDDSAHRNSSTGACRSSRVKHSGDQHTPRRCDVAWDDLGSSRGEASVARRGSGAWFRTGTTDRLPA